MVYQDNRAGHDMERFDAQPEWFRKLLNEYGAVAWAYRDMGAATAAKMIAEHAAEVQAARLRILKESGRE